MTNSGTSNAAVLNFGIPTGKDGEDASGGQADWNAAEGEPGHVLNRTHYSEYTEATVIPEYTGTVEKDGFGIPDKWQFWPSDGTPCTVMYNGKEYHCVARWHEIIPDMFPGEFVIVVGNTEGAIPDAEDTEPFTITMIPEAFYGVFGAWMAVTVYDESTTATISMRSMQEVIHKLDDKYVHSADWNAPDGEAGHVLNRTHYAQENWIFPEAELVKSDSTIMAAVSNTPVPGEIYTINWNGVHHECICLLDGGYFNFAVPESGTISIMGDYKIMFVSPMTSLTSLTLSIKGPDIIHPLDEKYLPDMTKLVMVSPNGTRYKITVDDSGALTTAKLS